MTYRQGKPYIRQLTAVQLATQADMQAVINFYRRWTGISTSVSIVNKSTNVLRVWLGVRPPLDLGGENYAEVAGVVGTQFSLPCECDEIFVAGVGGSAAFQLAVSERVG